jgi:alanine-glyoxylate transaminase/serine-glyoxylate transaminase/serine-pyruvate transaminase
MMENYLKKIDNILLMGPGPSCVAESVYDALSRPTLGHLDPNFIRIMDDIKSMLKQLFNTENRLTIPMSGTGSAGMEACFVNLIEPGDPVLILVNGVFGTRMVDVASRLGADTDRIDFEWGTPVRLDQVKEQLSIKNYKIVAVVHAETSTGVCNPVEEIGQLVKDTNALYLVDAVTSLGGIPVKVDEWGIDAIYSGTQKCLSCPPGLAPVSFSERAEKKLTDRKTKVPNWYLDLSMLMNYWQGSKRAYHHTAPINMNYALYQALYNILEEGIDKVHQRHMDVHKHLASKLKKLGVEMMVEEGYRLPMLNSVKVPEGIDEAEARSKLLNEHKIEIGAGLGPLAGKIWRIGIMGHTAYRENVDRFVNALQTILK